MLSAAKVVNNVVVAVEKYGWKNKKDDDGWFQCGADVSVDWQYINNEFLPPKEPKNDLLAVPLDKIRFFTVIETEFNITIDTLIALVKDKVSDLYQQKLSINRILYAQRYERNDSLLVQISFWLNLSKEDIDKAWVKAVEMEF